MHVWLAAQNSFSSSMIMINMCSPPKAIGAVHGAGQAMASFVRSVGPAVAGVMWGWSAAATFPFHQSLVKPYTLKP